MRGFHLFSALSLLTGSLAATFPNCTQSQIATLETAIDRATNKSYTVIEYLEDNPNGSDLQTAFFGAFSTERYNKVLNAFKKFAPDLATKFSYACDCQNDFVIATPTNTYGHMSICSVYFNEAVVPPKGQHRSQWDTLIHEATHFAEVLRTYDHANGVEACKALALVDPDDAVNTADCHARFAVEVPPFGP
ncbi:hypothetical protein JX265_005732 [Neoarthrinium moseri]|uniref:Lysine-specific metallo-endopeptidase domain-containing protein n=1 Tax=Neoarthrinium moseri TaxID=1658444 RepID=A0A9P9WN48_9PEZI|nr:uncharacterized protein JN550_013398 [Neoarthrinium moseri]KAI1842155.1 hypothetical protein JX266_011688 [Neoarthrinium moseri]KAI1857215.1 hypothetical protein JN550_013398 [Neoarthrinium moseri]KAI1871746.1 hypothetical protein JX265_005732 [Neoarthrinium moseri]